MLSKLFNNVNQANDLAKNLQSFLTMEYINHKGEYLVIDKSKIKFFLANNYAITDHKTINAIFKATLHNLENYYQLLITENNLILAKR